ncbi:DUF2254 domain-containing protein [Paraburkholderia sp. UYCP14C]|uniref:DUF2254 domain-containing protein n=1 Tax=Paraburkholderia sp. UYCP14C TaxID=2511130 RepID=UPI00101F8833|nr:DUF2254 domain-containing protein [Paraburkholderia sp. UYCP14C]RZF25679.1 DUF2254 domain-containing protein [Paraburkholderia sp. UYCP14C]
MAWNRRYSLSSYVRSALWVVPIISLLAALALNRASEFIVRWLALRGGYDLRHGFLDVSMEEAHAILDRVFTLNLSCLVFTFGSLLVAIQIAGGQYTPRIIATTLLRDNVIRWIVGLLVFSLLWTHRTMTEIGQTHLVPQLQVLIANIVGLGSLIAFIVLIDYSARLLRPVALVGRIAEHGFAVIESIYPHPEPDERIPSRSASSPDTVHMSPPFMFSAAAVVYYDGKSGVVLAANLKALLREATVAGCVIEFAVQIGDFLATDEPLFYLHGNHQAVDARRLQNLIALGTERTMEQDPMFAFRIEVDIALKALSPAINDPTTAVLALDQLHRLLRMVGKQSLANREVKDPAGNTRVLFRTPDWEDYVHISFREIRHCGAGSLQIERRLRAMIENLILTLPVSRHDALRCELGLLDTQIVDGHTYESDRELARVPDTQGLGGAWYRSSTATKAEQSTSNTS